MSSQSKMITHSSLAFAGATIRLGEPGSLSELPSSRTEGHLEEELPSEATHVDALLSPDSEHARPVALEPELGRALEPITLLSAFSLGDSGPNGLVAFGSTCEVQPFGTFKPGAVLRTTFGL